MIMKKMNLLPIEYQREYEVDTRQFIRNASIVLIIFSFTLFIFLGKYQLHALERDIESLQLQQEQLTKQNTHYKSLQAELNQLEVLWNDYNALTTQPVALNQLLEDLTISTPADTWFASVELTKEQSNETGAEEAQGSESAETVSEKSAEYLTINITGYSQSIHSVGNLTFLLNRLPYMDKVVIEHSSEMKIGDVSLIEFYLQGQIQR